MRSLFITILLAFGVFLCSCGMVTQETTTIASENTTESPEEYIFSDFYDICRKYDDLSVREAEKLSDIELYGVSERTKENEDKSMEHAVEVYGRIADKILENFKIKKGQKIILTGVVKHAREVGGSWSLPYGKISFGLARDWKGIDVVGCRTDKNDFLDVPDGTPVKICGTFAKYQLMEGTSLFDCELLEIIK